MIINPMEPIVRVEVDSGICGFSCVVEAKKTGRHQVSVKISGSDCEHIKRLSEKVKEMDLKNLFKPITKNPVFVSAQQSGCHPSCPVPTAVLKTIEVAMEMALPKNVTIEFKP